MYEVTVVVDTTLVHLCVTLHSVYSHVGSIHLSSLHFFNAVSFYQLLSSRENESRNREGLKSGRKEKNRQVLISFYIIRDTTLQSNHYPPPRPPDPLSSPISLRAADDDEEHQWRSPSSLCPKLEPLMDS